MYATALAKLQIFEGLPESAAQIVCDNLVVKDYDANQTILNEGDQVQALWIILEGKCVVSRCCQPGNERVLAELQTGDVFGEMSFVRTAPHSASIQTRSTVKVAAYGRSDFQQLFETNPEAASRIYGNIASVLAERLRRMDNWVCDLVDTPQGNDHKDEWESFRSAVYTNWNF